MYRSDTQLHEISEKDVVSIMNGMIDVSFLMGKLTFPFLCGALTVCQKTFAQGYEQHP